MLTWDIDPRAEFWPVEHLAQAANATLEQFHAAAEALRLRPAYSAAGVVYFDMHAAVQIGAFLKASRPAVQSKQDDPPKTPNNVN